LGGVDVWVVGKAVGKNDFRALADKRQRGGNKRVPRRYHLVAPPLHEIYRVEYVFAG